jgi:3-oxoacyl-[acyl-carrier-protein] synthase II
VSSLKSSIGHLLGGAGAVEAVVTTLALRERTAPPTLNHEQPDPELDLNYVPNEAQSFEPRGELAVAVSNSFGFGGHNAVLCLAA